MKKLLEKLLRNLIEKPLEKLKKWWDDGVDYTTPEATSGADGAGETRLESSGDAVDYSLLDFRWGGFKGGKAKLADRPRIKGLKVTLDGLSYSWSQGGCEDLGADNAGDAGCTICALFCFVSGKWVGGKFDWISTSRRTRSFENIHGGYNGWDPSALSSATQYAFVIVSKNGKARTNVITCGR